MKADLSNLAAPLLCIGCFSTLSVGCANQGTILELPQAPPAEHEPENLEQEGAKTSVEATTTPTPWFEQMPTELSVLAGNLPGAKRVAILVSGSEENSLSTSDNPVAPRPYDAVLGIYVNLINFFGQPLYSIGRPVSVDRLRAVLEALPEEEDVLFDVWAESRAGLALRYAVEHQPTGSLGPMRVVLVDVPNRGVSPTGWPTWEQRWDSYSPSPLVSGSAFLSGLNSNSVGGPETIDYVVVGSDKPRAVPRSSAMGFPGRSLQLIVRVSDARSPFPAVLEAPVLAARIASGMWSQSSETHDTAASDPAQVPPRQGDGPVPTLGDVILGTWGTGLERHVDSWLSFQGASSESTTATLSREPIGSMDTLAGITNPITVGYVPLTGEIILTGFANYARDPLTPDIFWTAFRAGRRAAVSIDPLPDTMRGSGQAGDQLIRYEGEIEGTRLGGVMFEADRVMKVLALGRDNVTGEAITAGVVGHQSIASATSLTRDASGGARWRLWLEPDSWDALEEDPLSATFRTGMRSDWKQLTPDYVPNQAVVAFTDTLTNQYADYALEQPALDALDQAAALIAAANWVRDANLTVFDGPPPPIPTVSTPDRTPSIQVQTNSSFDPWVVHVFQGGTVFCAPLRHVRAPGSRSRQLTSLAVAARPEGASAWRFIDGGGVRHAVAIPAQPRSSSIAPGIRNARDSATDPDHAPTECVADSFRAVGPLITDVTFDDAAEPTEVILDGVGFGETGYATYSYRATDFQGRDFSAISRASRWTPERVVVGFPDNLPPETTLVLHAGGRESNPVAFRRVFEAQRPNPPEITVVNRTDEIITVRIRPTVKGSLRDFSVAAGETAVTRVLPGRYQIAAEAAFDWSVGAPTTTATRYDAYEPGRAYTLTYEDHTFPVGRFIVQNDTGAPVTVTLTGTQGATLTVPIGSTILRLVPGRYTVVAQARCGSRTSTIELSAGSVDNTRYYCVG